MAMMPSDRTQGVVKCFDDEKGYGYITLYDGSKDFFVHYSEIYGKGYKYLYKGQRVEFEYLIGEKRPKAYCVVAFDY